MANVDELLGRLETQSSRPELTRGGIPQLTPQDIAAALGMCPNRQAADVYQAFVGESSTAKELDRLVAGIQFEEWRNRADRLVNAQLAEAAAILDASFDRPERLQRARLMLSGARAAMWPALVEPMYAGLRRAVIVDLRSPKFCPVCNGRKSVLIGELVVECQPCLGTGRKQLSSRKRAAEIGVSHSGYIRTWGPVYDWTLNKIQELISEGRSQFKAALGRAA